MASTVTLSLCILRLQKERGSLMNKIRCLAINFTNNKNHCDQLQHAYSMYHAQC